MYIVKIQTNKTKHDKNASNVVVRTRELKQKHFREFKTLKECSEYIAEVESQHPHTNEYGNTTEITGYKIYQDVTELQDEPIGDYIPELEEIAYQREQNRKKEVS